MPVDPSQRTTLYGFAMDRRGPRWLPWLALAAVTLGFVNFLWFLTEDSANGGDAGGLHAASLLLTHPLALAGGAYLLFAIVFPSMVGTRSGATSSERVDRIRASGPAAASTRTGGRFGDLGLTRPLVRVDVHPAGVVIGLFAMAPIALDASSITGVTAGRSWGTRTVQIAHRQSGLPADIRLYLEADSPVTEALRRLVVAGPAPSPVVGSVTATQSHPARETYPTVMKVAIIGGFGLSIVFLVATRSFASRLGDFGVVWSVLLVLIVGFNAWTYFVRNRHRW